MALQGGGYDAVHGGVFLGLFWRVEPPAVPDHSHAADGQWMAGLCLLSLGIFWLFPTAVPAAGIDWSLYPQMAIIKNADASGNACPSLHVAAAVFSGLWLDRVFRSVGAPTVVRYLNCLQCLAILWSTVATRQHVMLDVLAGTAVGTVFAVLSLRHALAVAGGKSSCSNPVAARISGIVRHLETQ